ncbi:hypothetical protein AB9K21_02270 [Anaplasma phagocytophilum]|uniref:Uncharacterized protein n=1 Tax=Anaplasma phagocytophilum str. ApNP TaxID=1359153 RepID=A0A0F3NF10_ANAPH|nr:hypothetical protein APHNP_0150 [Anaplasma phagocytophilum str. ApNP]
MDRDNPAFRVYGGGEAADWPSRFILFLVLRKERGLRDRSEIFL